MDFDFDEWAQLAKQDKNAFEKKRKEVLEQAQLHIAKCRDDKKILEGLQFMVDVWRQENSAVAACNKLTEMLVEQIAKIETISQKREQTQTGNIICIETFRQSKDESKT